MRQKTKKKKEKKDKIQRERNEKKAHIEATALKYYIGLYSSLQSRRNFSWTILADELLHFQVKFTIG